METNHGAEGCLHAIPIPPCFSGSLCDYILLGLSFTCVSASVSPYSVSPSVETLTKPTISVSQGTVIEHRENVTFCCDTPDTNITIRWVSNHQPLPSHERIQLSTDGKNLTILTVQRQDAGEYQCETWGLGLLLVKSSDPTYLIVYCESLSILPSPPATPASSVISSSLAALHAIQMWTCPSLNSRHIAV